MATDRVLFSLLERAGQLLREGTTAVYPNLTKPELLKFAATARALAASAEAEARSAPFPDSLPPALVMQWLRLREVPAALRVARSWRDESEQYFRQVAQHIGVLRGDSWRDSVECYVEWYRHPVFTPFQRFVFSYYAKRWVESDDRFIPIDEAVAVMARKYFAVNTARTIGQVKTAVAFLVSKDKLTASSTGRGHRCELQVEGLEALTPLQQRVLKYHIASLGGRNIYEVTGDLDIDMITLRTTVDFLKSAGHLESSEIMRGLSHWATRATTTIWPLQRRVLDYYAQHATSDVGLATNAVAASLGVDLARVRAAVAFLVRRGYLYSTIDEDHHKSTE
jgi:hypothetical protein